jgi:hypothetical protein
MVSNSLSIRKALPFTNRKDITKNVQINNLDNTAFKLSHCFILNANYDLSSLHLVDVGIVAGVLNVHAASVFMV